MYPNQRKVFVSKSKIWVFYSDGTNILLKTSGDGVIWSDGVIIHAGVTGNNFSAWQDGDDIHCVWTPCLAGTGIEYRKGTFQADGSISWAAAWQTAVAGGSYAFYKPTICVDTSGCPWIVYSETITGVDLKAWVAASTATDGTWSARSGHPQQLDTIYVAKGWSCTVIPLTAGKVFALWCDAGEYFYGKEWSGSAWGSKSQISTSTTEICYRHSAVSDGDDIYIAFLGAVNHDVRVLCRLSGSWSEVQVCSYGTDDQTSPAIAINPLTHRVQVMYPKNNTNLYGIVKETNWKSEIALSNDNGIIHNSMSSSCILYGNDQYLIYEMGSLSDYSIKCVNLSGKQGDERVFTEDGDPLFANNTITPDGEIRIGSLAILDSGDPLLISYSWVPEQIKGVKAQVG